MFNMKDRRRGGGKRGEGGGREEKRRETGNFILKGEKWRGAEVISCFKNLSDSVTKIIMKISN